MDSNKTDAPKTDAPKTGASNTSMGDNASDTVSAAKVATGTISAGTSVGDPGRTPMPHAQTGQSSTLASHTSKPLGGQAGATGAGTTGAGAQTGLKNEFNRHVAQPGSEGSGSGQRGSGQQQGGDSTIDSVRDAASGVADKASDLYEQARSYARETYDQAADWASDAYEQGSRSTGQMRRRSMSGARSARGGVERFIQENPVMIGVVGLAAGLLLGALLPRHRVEDEYLGEWGDEVREQGMRYAGQLREQGMEYVDDIREQGMEYAESLKEQGLSYAHEMAQRGREFVAEGGVAGDEGAEGQRPGSGRYQSH